MTSSTTKNKLIIRKVWMVATGTISNSMIEMILGKICSWGRLELWSEILTIKLFRLSNNSWNKKVSHICKIKMMRVISRCISSDNLKTWSSERSIRTHIWINWSIRTLRYRGNEYLSWNKISTDRFKISIMIATHQKETSTLLARSHMKHWRKRYKKRIKNTI